jgi:murein DD-endopeptidase MepM/ murein hydrolase activator NlpD
LPSAGTGAGSAEKTHSFEEKEMERGISPLPWILLLIVPISAHAENSVADSCMCLGLFEGGGKRIQQPLLTRTPLVNGARITSGFGMRIHPVYGYIAMHVGWDIAVPLGTPVRAVLDGVIQFSGTNGGYGNVIRIVHANSIGTAYGHLDRFAPEIKPGVRVRAGDVIGFSGNTGLSTGPHLHFEYLIRGLPVNPANLLCASQPTPRQIVTRTIRESQQHQKQSVRNANKETK